MRPAYWRAAWKKESSILRRFGPTFDHSQQSLNNFVERFTASLPDIRASHFQRPASAEALQIRDTFSRIFDERSAQSSLFSVSSKTSADTCRLDSTLFRGAYDAMALELSQEYSARAKSEPATEGSDCSFWPTANANPEAPNNSTMREGSRTAARITNQCLAERARELSDWPTPNVPNGGRKLAPEYVATKGKTPHGKAQVGLENAAEFWSTPKAISGGANSKREQRPEAGGPDLQEQVSFWTTPQAHDSAAGNPERVRRFGTQHGGANLADDVMLWPTPAGRDYKGDNSELHVTETGGGQEAPRSIVELRYAHLPIFAPGPSDHEAWRGIIERWPELAPAVADATSGGLRTDGSASWNAGHPDERGESQPNWCKFYSVCHDPNRCDATTECYLTKRGRICPEGWRWNEDENDFIEEEAEPELHRLADGIPAGMDFRVDRLRAGGNAVVAIQAAFAFVMLARKARLT